MVCRPASSEIATNGMPRQMLAAISEKRAAHGLPRKSMLLARTAEHVDQEMRDDRELRIVDPPERHRRQHGRHDPRQQHDGADQALERQVLVQQQRQPEAERELSDGGDAGVEDAVEHRVPPHRIAEQVLEVLQPDEHAAPADGRVGEGQPDAEAQRIGQEHRQQADRRHQAHDDQEHLVVEQPRQRVRLRAPGLCDCIVVRSAIVIPALRATAMRRSPASDPLAIAMVPDFAAARRPP